MQAVFAGTIDGVLVAGIGMTHDAGGGVVPQHPADPLRRRLSAVAADISQRQGTIFPSSPATSK